MKRNKSHHQFKKKTLKKIKTLLRTHVSEEREWDAMWPYCLMAYRSSFQESIGVSPFHLLHGAEMRLPCDNLRNVPFEEHRSGASYLLLEEKLREVQEKAAQKSRVAKERQKRIYDRTSRTRLYAVGDGVWLHSHNVQGHPKLRLPWEGPYCVIEHLPLLNYRIRLWGSQYGHTQIVHHNRLKPCHDPLRNLPRGSSPELHALRPVYPARVEDSDSEYSTAESSGSTAPMIVNDSPSSLSGEDSGDLIIPGLPCRTSRTRIPVPSRSPYDLRPRPE